MNKKLIEVALPLEKINEQATREKSIRHGHPSTLHLWWSRKPTAAARAVIWSSLVDDPSSHPEQFPTEEAQNKERERLFGILEKLVVWENSNDKDILDMAKAEIMKSTNNDPPALLDPFAGGGAIPLEAQRLGLEAHAHDLNPVAVMINKAMIEIPPRFAGMSAVNPENRDTTVKWNGAAGLAADVKYYGEWMKQEAFKRIGHLYPKVKDEKGEEHTVIAWIWARTVKCPNPACGCEAPLVSSFVLSTKKGNEMWVEPVIENNKVTFEVKNGKYTKLVENGTKAINDQGKGKKGAFRCIFCNEIIDGRSYGNEYANEYGFGIIPIAVVAESGKGRLYLSVNNSDEILSEVEQYYSENTIDSKVSHAECRGTFASNAQGGRYGFYEFKDYFTHRQVIALTTFSELVAEAQKKAEKDALSAGMNNDEKPLSEGGNSAKAYGEAVGVYLAFIVDKLSDRGSSICSWDSSRDGLRNTFGRQAIPMIWSFAEGNPFSNSSGCYDNMIEWIEKCLIKLPACANAMVRQFDAQSDSGLRNIMISTDPPYYDNIVYADLADYFYVWMRQSLKNTYPKLFRTMLVPKVEELVATPYRFEGSKQKAKEFFEDGMLKTCQQLHLYAREDIPVTIYYAYKQSDTDNDSSSGWETMLSSIINAGFTITGTWPMRTELINRNNSIGSNSLASSIVLVCRKSSKESPSTTRRSFVTELKRELKPALQKLQSSNIAPVDLAQSAIGPGMGVFSKYKSVLEADGTPMTVRSALQIINQELDVYFNEQDGELDKDSRFCVDLYTQFAFNELKFGDADTLARAKNTSVDHLKNAGVVYAEKGVVRLLMRDEIELNVSEDESMIWRLTQQLTKIFENDGIQGCADAIKNFFGSNAEAAKNLAYRLYTISERKGWNDEAYAYNNLVTAWPDIQSAAAEMQAKRPEQLSWL